MKRSFLNLKYCPVLLLFFISSLFFSLISCEEKEKEFIANNKILRAIEYSDIKDIRLSYTPYANLRKEGNVRKKIPLYETGKEAIYKCMQKALYYDGFHLPKCLNINAVAFVMEFELENKIISYEMSKCSVFANWEEKYTLSVSDDCYSFFIEMYKFYKKKDEEEKKALYQMKKAKSNNYIKEFAEIEIIKYVEKIFGKYPGSVKDYFFYEPHNEAEFIFDEKRISKEKCNKQLYKEMINFKYREFGSFGRSPYYEFLRKMMKNQKDKSEKFGKPEILETILPEKCSDCISKITYKIKFRDNIFVVWHAANLKSEKKFGLIGVISINGIKVQDKMDEIIKDLEDKN